MEQKAIFAYIRRPVSRYEGLTFSRAILTDLPLGEYDIAGVFDQIVKYQLKVTRRRRSHVFTVYEKGSQRPVVPAFVDQQPYDLVVYPELRCFVCKDWYFVKQFIERDS